jgi:leucyl aminopeptidase
MAQGYRQNANFKFGWNPYDIVMIPTSTQAVVALKDALPASTDAVVALIHKETGIEEVNPAAFAQGEREAMEKLLKAGIVTGKSNEVTIHLLEGKKTRRLIVIGLGNRQKFSAECLREAGVALARTMTAQRVASAAVVVPVLPDGLPGIPDAEPVRPALAIAVEALAEGFLLGRFNFEQYKGSANQTNQNKEVPQAQLIIVAPVNAQTKAALHRGQIIADAQNAARTVASRPGNDINPPSLAKLAAAWAKELGLSCRVIDEKRMRTLGMGGLLAVGGGSEATPPRLIALEYHARGGGASGKSKTGKRRPVLLVGKSITFDTGGISIKPADKMGKMIFDKCGGMAVLGAMVAIARLKPNVDVVGLLPAAENHVSGTAYRPGDILKMYNGVTVDVTNTDAEGRLVLGDALAWGIETYKPSDVVDLATLTGGVVIALGRSTAGAMANNDELYQQIEQAARRAGEKIWRLPLGDEHREQLKADAADIVNSAGREAHPLQGGAFLSHFVPEDMPWVHLDIAGVADTEKETSMYARGATGWGVRTLVEWISDRE